jgi:siroheme synthase-like protein
MESNNLYPIFLKLDEFQTLIVGGGNVGLEKVQFILRQSPEAKIRIVSKDFHPQIIRLAIENSNVKITERAFVNDDLNGIKLLILATNDNDLNKVICNSAKGKSILTNVVDNPKVCDFYTAAVMHKGPFKIAVSSNGVSPTLAKRLRDILEEVIPDEIENSAVNLQKLRSLLKGDLSEKIKKLNAITDVLVYDSYHKEKLLNSSAFQNIKLN